MNMCCATYIELRKKYRTRFEKIVSEHLLNCVPPQFKDNIKIKESVQRETEDTVYELLESMAGE